MKHYIRTFIGIFIGILVIISAVLIYNINRNKINYELDINKIKFAEQWQKINKTYKFSDEIKLNTNKDITQFTMNVKKDNGLKVKNIYMEWVLQGKKENQYRQLNIDAEQKTSSTAVNSLNSNESDIYKVSVEDFMTVLDKVNLPERIKEIKTDCDYYKIELFGLQKAKSEISERKVDGQLISEETDKSTGETIKKYYKHEFIIFNDKTSEVIPFGKTYTTKTDALDITITPMVKMKNGEYQGTPEVEIIYEINSV